MTTDSENAGSLLPGTDDIGELELTDEDVLDAMSRIPGYLDISTSDFRLLYHLAHGHAVDRLFRRISAGGLMLRNIRPLHPDTPLDQAARHLVSEGRKSLPVIGGDDRVIGILTESDFLSRLGVASFLELMLQLIADQGEFAHRCHDTPVSAAMTAPAISLPENAGYQRIVAAFRSHQGRSVPVVDGEGRLKGLLLRKDFVRACQLGKLP